MSTTDGGSATSSRDFAGGQQPGPAVLWHQADDEHPHDFEARRARYRELMIEHGHIVKREPGESRNLPCGWPHLPEADDA